ncbi:P-loop containing nucleoside triphosphate hydrolase protein [Crepidotus variabilis]|uniref:P-loop containing nucleoside triphosphate hydrolase protein n=1 Tax=Crepidotus variabilis TaxID=179855 RepID=A0A9P6JLA3_9AGAR|nr:P-loop containing nucleoside triphosphate hydrolase protein [Crepidotus variabilis]
MSKSKKKSFKKYPNIKHTKVGVWDLYEDTAAIPPSARIWPGFSSGMVIVKAAPYVWRMIKDVASIRECWSLLLGYLAVEFMACLMPALSLYYSGQLISIVQTAVDHRKVDTSLLMRVAVGNMVASLASRTLQYAQQRIATPLHLHIKAYYSVHIFHAMSRLDVPTFEDPAVQRQIELSLPRHAHSSTAFDAVTASLRVITTAIQLISQFTILLNVLQDQPDGLLLAIFSFAHAFFQRTEVNMSSIQHGIWVASTKNEDYIRTEGLKRAIGNPAHRKEIVAAGLGAYLLEEYRHALSRIADKTGDFFEVLDTQARLKDGFSKFTIFQEILRGLPEIIFTLRAVQKPSTIPLSLVSLNLITQTTKAFTFQAFSLYDDTGAIADKLNAVRLLYKIIKIPNRVNIDYDSPYLGTSFPEENSSLSMGVSVEFRDVSFIYPGSTSYALKNVSFKLGKGQLCVIVGNNGSGKSTILKLISRLYDPAEGQILINDIDIRTLRLSDLRRAISVLFQDYTLFPLSIRDNIALGDLPSLMSSSESCISSSSSSTTKSDLSKIRLAAKLGGAASFIERLPEGYDTYLDKPVQDYFSPVPDGSKNVFGRLVDYGSIKGAMGGTSEHNRGLSGGQMQRIALSRTFMRSVVSEDAVGMLLFDEPSASLDPTAEHDLFERLRKLRGSKTMIFSSHRFGNLTRHADLILYMHESAVVEEGRHDELLKKEGEYARIWMLQAQAFL